MLWPWSHPSIRLVQDAPIHKTILIKLKKIYLHIIFTLAAACIDWGHLPMSYTKKSLLILPSWSRMLRSSYRRRYAGRLGVASALPPPRCQASPGSTSARARVRSRSRPGRDCRPSRRTGTRCTTCCRRPSEKMS